MCGGAAIAHVRVWNWNDGKWPWTTDACARKQLQDGAIQALTRNIQGLAVAQRDQRQAGICLFVCLFGWHLQNTPMGFSPDAAYLYTRLDLVFVRDLYFLAWISDHFQTIHLAF